MRGYNGMRRGWGKARGMDWTGWDKWHLHAPYPILLPKQELPTHIQSDLHQQFSRCKFKESFVFSLGPQDKCLPTNASLLQEDRQPAKFLLSIQHSSAGSATSAQENFYQYWAVLLDRGMHEGHLQPSGTSNKEHPTIRDCCRLYWHVSIILTISFSLNMSPCISSLVYML